MHIVEKITNIFIFFIVIFVTPKIVNGQSNYFKNYLVITIEEETTSTVHGKRIDYWLLDVNNWVNDDENALVPLYLYGFSNIDFNECCGNDTLVLFNYSLEETYFQSENNQLQDQELNISNIRESRKKIQRVIKKWKNRKDKIEVFFTPVKGNFCFCTLKHTQGNTKARIGYDGIVALPISGIVLKKNTEKYTKMDVVMMFDYSELPFLSLHAIH